MAEDNGPQTIRFGVDRTIAGTSGRDTLTGATTSDTIVGGKGRDVLIGDTGDVTFDQAATSFEFHDDFQNDGWGLFEEAGGWRHEGNHLIELQASGRVGTASDGATVLELDSTGNSTVYRDFTGLDTAMAFTLSLDFSARPGVAANSNAIEIMWNGAVIDTITADGRGLSDFEWTSHAYAVSPDADGSARIALRGVGVEDTLGGIVDNVRLDGELEAFDAAVQGGDDLLDGGSGKDTLEGGAGNDLLIGGAGADQIDGGTGEADRVDYTQSARAVTIDLAAGTGQGGDAKGDVIVNVEDATGSESGDVLIGDDGSNRLNGFRGDDEIFGGAGNDHLVGYDGADALDGGAGTDTAVYGSSRQGVDVSLVRGTGLGGHAEGDTLVNIEWLDGSDFADRLTGDGGANRLNGRAGDDALFGLGGNDELEGGAGADALDGGTGTDTARYTTSDAGVNVDLLRGTGIGGHAEGDTLAGVEHLLGSAYADVLTGDGGVNRINGGRGDDVLDGGAGNDRLVGGEGADRMIGGEGSDTVDYGGVAAGVALSLATGGTGGDAAGDTYETVEAVQGSDFADTIEGNGGANRLNGGAGNDVLSGGGGNDTLIGSSGDDTLTGGAGNDVFLFYTGFGDDVVTDFEAGAGRTDRLWLRDMDLAFADLAFADTADGTMLTLGDSTLFLSGLAALDLAEDDFIF